MEVVGEGDAERFEMVAGELIVGEFLIRRSGQDDETGVASFW